MLHGNVLMADLDVDRWRNAQDLVLKSAKEAKRLVVMLEDGEVVKCRHTTGRAVNQAPTRVEDLNVAARSLYDLDLRTPTAWVFGNEGQGVRPELLACVPMQVLIPMPGATESLNVAAAAAICLFEAVRQRLPRT